MGYELPPFLKGSRLKKKKNSLIFYYKFHNWKDLIFFLS